VLRAARPFRVIWLISPLPAVRRAAGGRIDAMAGLGAVIGIIVVILYVSAVVATRLLGERFPQSFGTLGESACTLFQVMTLESRSMGIVRPVMEVYPYVRLFVVTYILISTFTMLNLFIAVVFNAIQAEHAKEIDVAAQQNSWPMDDESVRAELRALRGELRGLREALQHNPRSLETQPRGLP
jgi:voltage-gated sodium channel